MKPVISPFLVVATLLVSGVAAKAWQDAPSAIRQLFESGRYQEIVGRAQAAPVLEPENTYIVAQTYLKLQNGEAAKVTLAKLIERGANDPWALVARSERARIDQNMDEALSVAQAVVGQSAPGPVSAYALYQLGLVQSQGKDMQGAAESFEKATAIEPAFAYAHYYAGMAYSALHRVDRVASHFEIFLKLAPQAPERGAVESIMRTVRGR